jgi:hypothetical protein
MWHDLQRSFSRPQTDFRRAFVQRDAQQTRAIYPFVETWSGAWILMLQKMM